MPPDHLSTNLSVLPSVGVIPRLVAVVPAAGLSRRMGQQKLLLQLTGKTVIAHVISALRGAGIERCLVVIRPDATELARAVLVAGGEVVQPLIAPSDMRESVECALRAIEGRDHRHCGNLKPPSEGCDGWVLIPADHPTMRSPLIRDLIATWSLSPTRIAVPVYAGRRGHPTIFPWSVVDEVYHLPPAQGLNQVLRSAPDRVLEMSVTDASILDDLDTPADWLRLQQEREPGEGRPLG